MFASEPYCKVLPVVYSRNKNVVTLIYYLLPLILIFVHFKTPQQNLCIWMCILGARCNSMSNSYSFLVKKIASKVQIESLNKHVSKKHWVFKWTWFSNLSECFVEAVEMGNVFHSHKCLTISFTVCIITQRRSMVSHWHHLWLGGSWSAFGFYETNFIYPQDFKDLWWSEVVIVIWLIFELCVHVSPLSCIECTGTHE